MVYCNAMESGKTVLWRVKMDILLSTEITINLYQVSALLVLTTVAALYGMTRVALFINYGFVMYWGYVANIDKFYNSHFQAPTGYSNCFMIFGVVIVLLASFALLVKQD